MAIFLPASKFLQDILRLFDEFFNYSYKPYLRSPFNVLAETPTNMSTNFSDGGRGIPPAGLVWIYWSPNYRKRIGEEIPADAAERGEGSKDNRY